MFDQEFLDFQDNTPRDLKSQIDVLPWLDLARHFAFGRLYVVRKPWNLLEAATLLKDDNVERLKAAMESGEFGVPTPDEATAWHAANQNFDVLVISPFVLVEPRI